MGASGTGKSTLGAALAVALGWRFVEGDALHPPANVEKMRAGIPLDEADRVPFLEAVARAMDAARPGGVVVACSALKRRHRDFLRAHAPDAWFVLPQVARDELAQRMAHRAGHFMPPALLDSQLHDFEPPRPDEPVLRIDGGLPPAAQVAAVIAALRG